MFIILAFIQGLLVALNPCQIAINISALTYLSERSNSTKELQQKALLYTTGRVATYTLLAFALMIVWEKGTATESIRNILSRGEDLLPYLMIIIGAFMLYRVFRHHEQHGDECHNCGQTIRRNGPSGALVLGLMLAFAFCPESAVIYFGMMMPLAVTNTLGALAPLAFAIASVIPVLLMAHLMTKANKQAKAFALRFKHFQQIVNAIVGTAFIVAAIILIVN